MPELNPIQQGMSRYWSVLSKDQKVRLAEDLNTSVGYLRQVFLYGKQVGPQFARQLEEKTSFSKELIRPDIFGPMITDQTGSPSQNKSISKRKYPQWDPLP